MKKRERQYLKRKVRIVGFRYREIPITAYDCEKKVPVNDEPGQFSNFALMMPKSSIKMPSKKEMKKAWYGNSRIRRTPLFSNKRHKPWEKVKMSWSNDFLNQRIEKSGDRFTNFRITMPLEEAQKNNQ